MVFGQPSKVINFEEAFPNDKAEVANPNEVPISKILSG